MSSLPFGVYAAFNGEWKPLKPLQVEAYNDCYSKHIGMMYSMGMDPVYGKNHGINSCKTRYEFRIKLSNNIFYMQLGDGLFHEIIEVKKSSEPQTSVFFDK